MPASLKRITFGNGCFWCTEAVFQSLKGVTMVASGYMGGTVTNPTYMEISNGKTGHVEVVDLEFDDNIISMDELLLVFFKTHNPTTLNRQGGDTGSQYRSAIFYHTDEQKLQAEAIIEKLTAAKVYESPIVTAVVPASEFYKAEAQHQNYYNSNRMKLYCVSVIQPKLNKLFREFTHKIKPDLL